ncbi:Flavin containing amine oxidoreductase [Musa troglodytarum]|uniref:Flavin containing amine oxidoreductase n=2 Tax=Musa troglodytarum TaxID=320322 RepID=A0A9E7K2D0_9LILI|nr:Flavin containing amine oxidoreductase [Musa troglodytarum]URE00875.1 Flavin containing amine oxidoreductase [Musa troglodytarum]
MLRELNQSFWPKKDEGGLPRKMLPGAYHHLLQDRQEEGERERGGGRRESSLGAAMDSTSVIIIGAGMSGISAAKTLSDAGVKDILILEATNRIGGRIRNTYFADLSVETGANWIEGVHGEEQNPIWEMAQQLGLRTFRSDYSNLSSNTYKQDGGRYEKAAVEAAIDESEKIHSLGEKYSKTLPPSGRNDISISTFQRLENKIPSTPLEMIVDYYSYDYEFAEPPRVTSLQNTVPLPTFDDFGDNVYFVADERGYKSLVYNLATMFLKTNSQGVIVDPRLQLGKVVTEIQYSGDGATVSTDDTSSYRADFVLVSVSIGVLQSDLIKFNPVLPKWKILALYEFDMAVYTKIFLKFPFKFWPDGDDREFFLYASKRRGYYPVWQHFEKQYPGANILMVTVTDEESRRIEQQDESTTKTEAMEVLRSMFGKDIPQATDILVPRWWSNKFFRGSFSNWPLGVNRHEFDSIKAPIKRLYFTGEHTSEHYNGYVHGAYLAGIDSANMIIQHIRDGFFEVEIKPKDSY